MHRRGIQRVVAVHHPQEARGLLKGLFTEAANLEQLATVAEGTVTIAVIDDVLGDARVQAGDPGQQRRGRGIQIDADRVHTVLNHRVQPACQLHLRNIVLILADADCLGLNLHQFGQRVLQTAGDGHRATVGHVQIRKLTGRQLGGRVHRRARLGDHHLLHFLPAAQLDQVGSQLVGFTRGGAVADGNQVNLMLAAQRRQGRQRAVPVIARRMGEDSGGVEQLAGGINHHHLDPGTQPRVEAQRNARAGRGRQQQVFQVAGEYADRLVFGGFAQLAEQFGFQMAKQLDPPGPAHNLVEPAISRAALIDDANGLSHQCLTGMHGARRRFSVAQFQGDAQHALVAAAQNRQRAVRRHLLQRLIVFEIVGKLGAFLLLADNHPGHDATVITQRAAQAFQQTGVLGKALHQDVLGPIQSGLGVRYALIGINITGSGALRIQRRISKQRISQRLQARLNGDLALGAALGLVGQVKVFQPGLGVGLANIAFQLRAQLALLGNAREHRGTPVFQFTQIAQALFEIAQLGVVQTAGYFLAVTGNKRDAGALVQQGDGSGDLLGANRQFTGDARGNTLHGETLPLLAMTGRAV